MKRIYKRGLILAMFICMVSTPISIFASDAYSWITNQSTDGAYDWITDPNYYNNNNNNQNNGMTDNNGGNGAPVDNNFANRNIDSYAHGIMDDYGNLCRFVNERGECGLIDNAGKFCGYTPENYPYALLNIYTGEYYNIASGENYYEFRVDYGENNYKCVIIQMRMVIIRLRILAHQIRRRILY